MLPSSHKLKDPLLIRSVLKAGRRAQAQHLSVSFQSGLTSTFQAAVVISRKIAGTAVVRNRMRRVIFARLEPVVNLGARSVGAIVDKESPNPRDEVIRGALVVLVSRLPEDETILETELNQCLSELSLV